MAYNLTAQDLQKLSAMGVNVNGVPEGAEATPEEMAALGVTDPTAIVPEQPSIPVTAPDAPSVKQVPAGPVKPLPDVQAPPATAAAGSDMSGLLGMLAKQSEAPTDPYENLSKRQRMMLGFAAIQDAGQALLGKEGRSFERLMGRFNEMTDMERKRQASQAQQALLAKLYGGGAGMGGPVDFSTMDVEGLEAYRRKLLESGFVINPATGEPLIPTEVTKLRLDEIDRAIASKKLGEKKAAGEQEQIDMLTPIVSGALDYINPNGAVDEGGEPVLNPDIASKITRGWAAFSEDPNYMRFSNQLETLKSTYTFENMTRLKEQGVAFGGLSEGELSQVAALIGTLDPKDPLGTFSTLKRINEKLNKKAKKVSPQSQGGDGLTFDPETGEFN